jgi:hypothetical protein
MTTRLRRDQHHLSHKAQFTRRVAQCFDCVAKKAKAKMSAATAAP